MAIRLAQGSWMLRVVAVAFLLVTGFGPARAQVMLDVSKITCWQFATYKVANPEFVAIWVSGYHHGKRGETVLDTEAVKANVAEMQTYCTKNPEVPFMQAVEHVLGAGN